MRRSKPKRMLSCAGMLLEFEFLVGHNNIHIVLFCSYSSEEGKEKMQTERLEGKENLGGGGQGDSLKRGEPERRVWDKERKEVWRQQ